MKKRLGFVSNSSSASFIVKSYYVSPQVRDWIYDPKSAISRLREIYDNQNSECDNDGCRYKKTDDDAFNSWLYDKFYNFEDAGDWSIWTNDDGDIEGSCIMDNFNFYGFLKALNITFDYRGD